MQYNTESKARILAFLKSNKEKSFTAEEIAMADELSGVGKSTVYRRLAALSACGEVRRIRDERSRGVSYQHVDKVHCSEHLHLKCNSCGKLFHLDAELSRSFRESIMKSKHFRVDPSTLLVGVCDRCSIGGGV